MDRLEWDSFCPEDTFAIGKRIGEQAVAGQVYTLIGDLGVGKTVFTQGVAAGLGIKEPVNSPTFTIVQVYEEGRLPFYHFDVYRIGDVEEMEEERRLCYVAITRAKEELHLINARRRTLFGKEQANPVSRFISEIGKELLETNVKEEELPQREQERVVHADMFREEEVDYNVGDYVYHDVFGTGKVLSVEKSVIKIAFKMPYGIKTLMKNHKSLRKV